MGRRGGAAVAAAATGALVGLGYLACGAGAARGGPPASLPSLGELAAARGMWLGGEMTEAVRVGQAGDAARYASLFGPGPAPRQYSLATVGNSLKWVRLEKEERQANFTAADAAVDFLERAGAAIRGHNLVWPAHNPPWLVPAAPEMSPTELSETLSSHVTQVVGRYAGRLLSWDVVNEPLRQEAPECRPYDWGCGLLGLIHWSGAQPVDWTQVEGDLGRGSYIEVALRAARAADPGALLMLNEFDVHGGNDKTTRFLALCRALLEAGAPLDGVGVQMHLSNAHAAYNASDFASVLESFADLGLAVHVTELDILPDCTSKCYGNATSPEDKLKVQADVYSSVLRECLRSPACEALVFWNPVDSHTDKGNLTAPGMSVLDNEYRPKPAFWAIAKELQRSLGGGAKAAEGGR